MVQGHKRKKGRVVWLLGLRALYSVCITKTYIGSTATLQEISKMYVQEDVQVNHANFTKA